MNKSFSPTRNFLRRLWLDESGQSSFFAVLTLFLLLACIGFTYNVSMVVSRRVRLQNAADAAALSGAIVEANALTAIAWLNGCQTYIHARMQEIMLDIPYPATAIATAEWGRYVMNRHGRGDLTRNPVEMNHGTNKAGILGGLTDQVEDLFEKLGGVFTGLNPKNPQIDEKDKKEIENLLAKFYDENTPQKEKDRIQQLLKSKYGIPVQPLQKDTTELEAIMCEMNAAKEHFEKTVADYGDASQKFAGDFSRSSFSGCGRAEQAYDMMKDLDDNIKSSLSGKNNEFRYEKASTYRIIKEFIKSGSLIDLYDPLGKGPLYETPLEKMRQKQAELELESTDSNTHDLRKLEIEQEKQKVAEKIKAYASGGKCQDTLDELDEHASTLQQRMQAIMDAGERVSKASKKYTDAIKKNADNTIKQDHDAAQKTKNQLLDRWEEEQKGRKQVTEADFDIEHSSVLNSHNDPPEPWALTKMTPIPLWNPYGPDVFMGRMTPLGTPLSKVGIDYKEESSVERDKDLDKLIKEFAGDDDLKDGLPPWDELKTAFAGPFGRFVWPEIMRIRYSLNSAPDSMGDFYAFFHNTLVKEARKWIGYRKQNDKSFAEGGIRPGEMWIRQLSQVASAIASALPKLVKNEIVYTLAVNASTRTRVAMYPNPEDDKMWGNVAFAQTDQNAGESFFRYDGWYEPPPQSWTPPPNYVNMYTAANAFAPAISETVRLNNPAVWQDKEQHFANRFLNESRRQNMRMRTESLASVGVGALSARVGDKLSTLPELAQKAVGGTFDSFFQHLGGQLENIIPAADSTFPGLSYATLVDRNGKTWDELDSESRKKLGYFKMNKERSFYWDEYAGRVGGDDNTDGPGGPVRVAVKCWNQNDRVWRQPKKDAPNNNKLLMGLFDGLTNPFTLTPFSFPMPYASSHYSISNSFKNMLSRTQLNYNLSPRCQIGYAPGSNVFGLGHAMFIPSHGDSGDAFGAADGHWHFMHYHSHSIACQTGFPGLGQCTAIINCILPATLRFFFKRGIRILDPLGPYDSRTGYDSTMHFPYKHWDGTMVDDGIGSGDWKSKEAETARNRHIYCRVSVNNNFPKNHTASQKVSKALSLGKSRQPPFTLGFSSDGLKQLVPPLSMYEMVDNCPQLHIFLIFFDLTICLHIAEHILTLLGDLSNVGLHRHMSCGKAQFPKDLIPIYNTPVLWNWGDTDPSAISMWGAFLSRGDMEGDFFMGLGSGDRFFYPEIMYKATDAVGNLFTNHNRYATGRARRFTKLNNPAKWLGEVAGTLGGGLGTAADFIGNLGFLGDLSAGVESAQGGMTAVPGMKDTFGGEPDFGGEINLQTSIDGIADNYEFYQSGSTFNEVFTSAADIVTRWGHHRFMTCPLCMSFCPLGCDYHKFKKEGSPTEGSPTEGSPTEGYPIRHWGGDYGGAGAFDVMPARGESFGGIAGNFYKAIGFLSIMPGLLSTGDQKSDAGMTYSNVLRGHDYSPQGKAAKDSRGNWNWYGKKEKEDIKKEKKIPYGNSYFDLGVDLDDGLSGNGPFSPAKMENSDRDWRTKFPLDRFVREWMTPIANDGQPSMALAPAVVITENFMRYAVTVAVVEEYKPLLWMFGKSRPMLAVATAKCGFIERPDVLVKNQRFAIDGLGAGGLPQIITGVGEPDGTEENTLWDLDRVWSNFLDFPNERPLGESNLYYGDWGAKLVPTRLGILANKTIDTTNPRRNIDLQNLKQDELHLELWEELGLMTCYRGDGQVDPQAETLAQQCRMSNAEWANFSRRITESSGEMRAFYRFSDSLGIRRQ